MPGDIPLKGGAENPQQMVLKTEKLDKEVQKGLIVVFTETVSFDDELVEPKELWNWVHNVCQQCLSDSSKGHLSQQPLKATEAKLSDQGKFDQIKQHHHSPIAGHPGRAKI